MDNEFYKEQQYLRAKKKVKNIKGFYIQLLLYVFIIPIIISVNLLFSPGYHWFWFSVVGWGIGVFFHWLAVFGFDMLGFGKDWEENKVKELMDKTNK